MIDKDHIIEEIRRTALENNGKPLGRTRFQRETGIKLYDWYGVHWTAWGDALIEAGFQPNEFQLAHDDQDLLRHLLDLVEELDRFPTYADIRIKSRKDPTFPGHSSFGKLGSKYERIQKVLEFAEANNASETVIGICQAALAAAKPAVRPRLERFSTDQFSFVYLMKSGKYYKIGHSNCAERRAYELRILMPEKLELVHKIKTDDPQGIEAYWHNRFAGKRKGVSEWFDLTASDIRAFKLRKFM